MDKYEAAEAFERDEEQRERRRQLLRVAYWYHVGLRAKAPKDVLQHPMWPANNDKRTRPVGGERPHLTTANAGRDRLWEAIEQEFGLDLRPD